MGEAGRGELRGQALLEAPGGDTFNDKLYTVQATHPVAGCRVSAASRLDPSQLPFLAKKQRFANSDSGSGPDGVATLTAVVPLEVLGTDACAQPLCCHTGKRKPVSSSDGTRAAVAPPATGCREQGSPIGGGTSCRRRDAGTVTALGTGKEGGGTHAAVQTEAKPCSVETGVGTGSWGGTCDAATSAAVDSREQGTCMDTVALAHAGTQADVAQQFSSIDDVRSFCSYVGDTGISLPANDGSDATWPPHDDFVSVWRLLGRTSRGASRR